MLFLLPVLLSCKRDRQDQEVDIASDIQMIRDLAERLDEIAADHQVIFYGIYSPVEMSAFFERHNIGFDPGVLHPIDHSTRYMKSDKVALNIGVYGVDLSYIKMFDQPQEAFNYFVTIGKLSRQLGLPDELIRAPAENYEKNLENPDKLVEIATTTYVATEQFLKQNDREYAAVLMLAGGWVEAMYIATQAIFSETNPEAEIIERIAAQKYSLNQLIVMLQNQAQNETVAYYLHLLNVLKKYFDQFEVYFDKEGLVLDTESTTIQGGKSYIDISSEIVNEIKRVIAGIRYEIVS